MTDILYETQDQVAILTFNRPAVLNVMRRAMFQEMLARLDEVARADGIRALVITGAGRAFSAGIDLEEVSGLFDGSLTLEQARAELDEMQELTRRMVSLPKPIVAAINGVAIGAGAEVALASDLRLASQTAFFEFAEVKRGLFETNGVMHRLPRLVGMGRAAHLLLTGERLPAQAALEMGLVTRILPADMLLGAALELARTLAANAPISMRLVKQVLHQSYDLDLESVMRLETEATLECLASEDLREGVQAFIEKRAQVYKGK